MTKVIRLETITVERYRAILKTIKGAQICQDFEDMEDAVEYLNKGIDSKFSIPSIELVEIDQIVRAF